MKTLPAEWESQSFLQLTFPHKNSDWGYMLDEVIPCFVTIISEAAEFQQVLVVCDEIESVKKYFNYTKNIHFVKVPSNDTWARDHGGITVIEEGQILVMDFVFNGWGNKFPSELDNEITGKLFKQKVLQNCQRKKVEMVLEGGSVESDGNGTIFTTSECLLSPNRNPDKTKTEIERLLKENFGAKRILWLDYGHLAGDDTDAHIDTLARFCDVHTIAYVGCEDKDDEHYDDLKKMEAQLQTFSDNAGEPYRLVKLPMPDPCYDVENNRLPATYANFTIINNAVLVPVYGVPQDEKALNILSECFRNRKIIDINCRSLIEQHGSLHCVTMQYPEGIILGDK